MPKNTKPSVSEMRRFLSYDPNSGALTWRARNADDFIAGVWSAETQANSWNSRYAGKSAFDAISSNGYKKGTINNHTCLAHRVCWAIYYGTMPDDQIDHINGVRTDNRISNLRDVSCHENRKNSSRNCRNTTGFTGVSKKRGKYRAAIHVSGKNHHLGTFSCAKDAYSAYLVAKKKYGYSDRHGM